MSTNGGPPKLAPPTCKVCHKCVATLKVCARCKSATYCSKDCQSADWKTHKPFCRDPNAPKILIIAAGDSQDLISSVGSHLLAGMKKYASVTIATTREEAQGILREGAVRAVIVSDGEMLKNRSFRGLKNEVVTYAKNGGTLILGAAFACFCAADKFDTFMHESFSLPWKFGSYHRTTVYLNSATVADSRFKDDKRLHASYSQKAVCLGGVDVGDRVYVPDEGSRVQSFVFSDDKVDTREAPVCWKKVGEGWLGYVGDVNSEDESTAVHLAMCRLG